MQRISPSNNSRGRQLRAIEVQSKYKGKIEMELHAHTVENMIIKYNPAESYR